MTVPFSNALNQSSAAGDDVREVQIEAIIIPERGSASEVETHEVASVIVRNRFRGDVVHFVFELFREIFLFYSAPSLEDYKSLRV